MKHKSLKDIYKRNFKATFFGGFTVPEIYLIGVLVPIIHLVLLPLTLTFGAGIKSLIDFFSRKEIPETSLRDAEGKIPDLDTDNTTLLIQEIYKYKPQAQSNSSKQLINGLKQINRYTENAIATGYKEKKQQLQKEQLGIDKDPSLLNVYQSSYISNLALDETRQQSLDSYMQENKKHCKSQQLTREKTIILDYLSATHNTGKRMQHIICNFFSPAPRKQPLPPTENNTIKSL